MHESDRQKLNAQLMRHEGSVRDADGLHIAYRCPAGKLTIGYGHNLDFNPVPGLGVGSRLNEEQARRLLEADVLDVQKRMEGCLPWTAGMDAARYCVLVNLAFNIGIGGLLQFKRMLAALKAKDYATAVAEMLDSKWATDVGPRRSGELRKQMETGEWR